MNKEDIIPFIIVSVIMVVLVIAVAFVNWLLRYGWFLLFLKNGG